MAYCYKDEDSDVYVYQGHDGGRNYWMCRECPTSGVDYTVHSREELILHLMSDREHGFSVPLAATGRLSREISERRCSTCDHPYQRHIDASTHCRLKGCVDECQEYVAPAPDGAREHE